MDRVLLALDGLRLVACAPGRDMARRVGNALRSAVPPGAESDVAEGVVAALGNLGLVVPLWEARTRGRAAGEPADRRTLRAARAYLTALGKLRAAALASAALQDEAPGFRQLAARLREEYASGVERLWRSPVRYSLWPLGGRRAAVEESLLPRLGRVLEVATAKTGAHFPARPVLRAAGAAAARGRLAEEDLALVRRWLQSDTLAPVLTAAHRATFQRLLLPWVLDPRDTPARTTWPLHLARAVLCVEAGARGGLTATLSAPGIGQLRARCSMGEGQPRGDAVQLPAILVGGKRAAALRRFRPGPLRRALAAQGPGVDRAYAPRSFVVAGVRTLHDIERALELIAAPRTGDLRAWWGDRVLVTSPAGGSGADVAGLLRARWLARKGVRLWVARSAAPDPAGTAQSAARWLRRELLRGADPVLVVPGAEGSVEGLLEVAEWLRVACMWGAPHTPAVRRWDLGTGAA